MRILYIQQHFATNRGEAGVRGYQLVKTLADRGHEVTVVCGENWRDSALRARPRGRSIDLDGFEVVQLPVFYSNHQTFSSRLASFLRFALLACREVSRREADLIFASSTPLTVSIPALWGRAIHRRPYVLEVRDLWPDLPVAMGIIRNPVLKRALFAWEAMAYRFAAGHVALAPGIREGIARRTSVSPDRVIMIPNGADTLGIRPERRNGRSLLRVPEEALVLGYTGTHGAANGLDAVLDAAAALQRRGVDGVVFALIGDGREKERLVQRADDEGLDSVRFFDLVDKATYALLLSELDVGMQILQNVSDFYWGTSPNKFFDYLAAGKPVLVNYPGWVSELVTEARCGVVVPPEDREAFADAVESLLHRREELPAMGFRARALAEERFSQQEILHELAEWLEHEVALA
ncbi:MAG TPA: glycosyltransferase family 4 protein [Thermoanaerobaculia bacterium]|nr:glycosyltransferase family 4 protein [Thermoanaerobaculia bacterium]